MKKDIYYIIGIVILVILLLLQKCDGNRKLQEKSDLINSLSDSIIHTTNKLGQSVAKISVLETSSTKDFLKIRSSDSTIIFLQGKVKEYKSQLKNGGSITTIGTNTNINSNTATTVKWDTIKTGTVFPVYESKLTDKWYNGFIRASHDTIKLKLNVKNDYTVVIGEEGKLFRKKTTFVEVTNLNPNTETTTLRTYQVKNDTKPKRFGIGVIIGYGIGVNLVPSPIIGIGGSYNFINF